ncbi:MAG: extracellular solute-binding protein [Oscillospiraceae bacterium]|jgi:ABC-type glycerol-3-phosphate transport system substrate-binding protein|nr:extracellular solute-binding protein [Oscillospiraceae bacterium]
MKKSRRIMVLALCLLLLAAAAACNSTSAPPDSGANPPGSSPGENDTPDTPADDTPADSQPAGTDRYQIGGKVVAATNAGRSTDLHTLWENFNTYYPNIELEIVEYETNTAEFLTAQATAGTMPDVVIDDADQIYYYISQGWVYPLDSFVENDADFGYVPEMLTESYTFGDRLYALPMQTHFNVVFVNMDLLNALNMDPPEFDWTPEDYREFLKNGTTDEYSGTEILWGIDEILAGAMNAENDFYGFSLAEHKFNMSESWVDAVGLMREMREYPGLEAWSLRNSGNDGEENDYTRKFGSSNVSDNHMALKLGKVLSDPRGTWDANWLKTDCDFAWEFFPFPQGADALGHLPMHVDCSWVVSTAQAPEAAFEVARFFTYSLEGNLERMTMHENGGTDAYTVDNDFYIPTTNHPDVRSRFENLPGVTDGLVYMFDNMKNSFRADLSKLVPGWSQVNDEYLSPLGNEVRDGITEAASVAAELDNTATAAIQNYWTDFLDKLSAIQTEFDSAP